MSCGDTSSPSTPPPGDITEIKVSLSPTTMPYVPTSLVVTAVDSNGTTVTTAEGPVLLSLEGGGISLDEINLEKGQAESELRIEAPITQVVLTATFGEFTTQTTVDLNPIQPVPGDAQAMAAEALPSLPFLPRDSDYSTEVPELEGIEVSINTITAVLNKEVSVQNLNAILEKYEAGVVAFSPGIDGVAGPMVAIRLSTTNHAELVEKLEGLKAENGVIAAAGEFVDGSRLVVPALSSTAGWTWEREDQLQGNIDINWGLEAVRAPQLWNFNAVADLASAREGRDRRTVGVIEFGFLPHEDIVFLPTSNSPFLLSQSSKASEIKYDYDHSSHVMGVIGAVYDNRRGRAKIARLLASMVSTHLRSCTPTYTAVAPRGRSTISLRMRRCHAS